MSPSRILLCLTLLWAGVTPVHSGVSKSLHFRTPLAKLEIDSQPMHNPGNPFDEYTNIRINSDNSGQLQNEEQACISPIDSNIFVAVWRAFRLGYRRVGVGYSHDAGLTWTDHLFPAMYYPWQSDPTLVVDADGNFTANVITFDNNTNMSHIIQVTSLDGGTTWQDSVWVVHNNVSPVGFEDKQMFAVDNIPGSPYMGTFYCPWTHFYNYPFTDSTHILMTYKRPGEAYSQPMIIDSAGDVQWSNVCVGPNGIVYVSWISYPFSGILISRSVDGGVNWSHEQLATSNSLISDNINPQLLVFAYGAMACDVSGGEFNGRLYMIYTDRPTGVDTDVFLIYSDDEGVTWSTRQEIPDAPHNVPNDQFHPWVSVDEAGRVWCLFYDRRNDPNNLFMDSYFTVSTNGGVAWRANERVSTVSSNPGAGSLDAGLIGEYIGWQARYGEALAVWTDTRNGNQDAYSALVDSVFPPNAAHNPRALLPSQLTVSAYPNPTNNMATISYALPLSGNVSLKVYDITGRMARTLELGSQAAGDHSLSLDMNGLASGIYLAEVQSANLTARTKLVLLK